MTETLPQAAITQDRDAAWLGFVHDVVGELAPHAILKGRSRGEASIDGDVDKDGYSIDSALDAFEAGRTPSEYCADVLKRRFARAPIV